MSEEFNIDDELLGRWLAGELSGEELEKFESSDQFKTYQMIAQYSDQIQSAEYDTEGELAKLQTNIRSVKDEPTVIKMPIYRRLGIAAGFVLLIGLGTYFAFFNNPGIDNTEVFTAQGETKEITLPDNSTVNLNISSTLEYNKENWDEERTVHLEGEGYFKVEKGSKFTVDTDHGTIEVLGTEFNIRSRQKITEVICYEGKVRVTDLSGESTILTQGMAVKIDDGEMDTEWSPPISADAEWKNGASSFHAAPFANVIEELENQYKITVDLKTDMQEKVYYGAFPHDNLEQALQMVVNPYELKYTLKNDTVVVIE